MGSIGGTEASWVAIVARLMVNEDAVGVLRTVQPLELHAFIAPFDRCIDTAAKKGQISTGAALRIADPGFSKPIVDPLSNLVETSEVVFARTGRRPAEEYAENHRFAP